MNELELSKAWYDVNYHLQNNCRPQECQVAMNLLHPQVLATKCVNYLLMLMHDVGLTELSYKLQLQKNNT